MDHFYEKLKHTAETMPEQIAFTAPNLQISYAQLFLMSQAAATCLCKQIGPHQPVAILMDGKSALCVPVMLGALFANCFYAPLDPTMPEERLSLILDNFQPALIIADAKVIEKAASVYPNTTILDAAQVLATTPDVALIVERGEHASDDDLATVMYTSGSTGIPKGVSHTRLNLEVQRQCFMSKFHFTQETVLANQSPWYYSNSLLALYVPFALGAKVVMLPPSYLSFPKKFISYLQDEHVTELTMTPSSYVAIANSGILTPGCLPEMKQMFLVGELMPRAQLQQWMEALPNAKFTNGYGCTETLNIAADQITTLEWEGVTPIGSLFDTVRIHLIRDDGTEAAPGETGELYVSSPLIMPGYYRDPERTSTCIVSDPLGQDQEPWFRTGDYGMMDENGSLYIVGRKDSMIKHHGYRMELGDVEAAVCAVPGCLEAVCLYHAETDDIWCFIATNLTKSEIQSQLKTLLERYMLPDHYVLLEQMPHNTSLKIDRALLRKQMNDSYSE